MNTAPTTTLAGPVPGAIATQAQGLAHALDIILASLNILVAAGFRILGPHTGPLWNRISRARRSLAALLALLAAGRLPRLHSATPGRKGGPAAHRIPRRRAWLVIQLRHNAAAQ